ncbi:MAG: hypothetical protein MI757_05335 [Pirellulales bacterium]|nr:hypothetical protein [Pirellulales bacterium]
MEENPDSNPSETHQDLTQCVQDYYEAAAAKARAMLATTCDQLAEQGVDTLRIAYDGYGDSGSVESITAFADKKEMELDDKLHQTLRDAAYDLLPGGWEINEGSYGELVVDVANRQVSREHNWRVESSEYEGDTFAL